MDESPRVEHSSQLSVYDFRRGTAEYVLVLAGLISLTRVDECDTVAPGPKLAGLFKDQVVPSLDKIVPPLVSLIVARAFDKAGFIYSGTMGVRAMSDLWQAGLTSNGNITLCGLLNRAVELAAEELTAAKKMYR